ncbi:MAG: FAD-dependent oxidoreductase [Opitutaceae bacterium]|nr:FAD-dependent oxidoreductase [Opitutaceae bacterium]
MSHLHYYSPSPKLASPQERTVDLCCYGQSPAAITAAVEARRHGLSTVVVLNARNLGGLSAGGLSNTDIGNKHVIGGLAREFYQRVGAHYERDEEWRFEPHVAESVFAGMLSEAGVAVLFREYPVAVSKVGTRLHALQCESGLTIVARQFIDASYEGDLMALAGVRSHIGREGNDVYGESYNGVQVHATHQFDSAVDPYRIEGDSTSGLLPGINPEPLAPIGSGDQKLQAYNFRLCLTQAVDRIPFLQPPGYDPLDYELLARYFRGGWRDLFHKFDRIRGGKADVNNHGAVSTDFIGGSWSFATATWPEREKIFQAHVRWQQGLLWFLATDPRVPVGLQRSLRSWGLPRDEFLPTGGWPPQLYIREARRMVSDYVITEHDCLGRRRATDGVGMGAYGMDSHNCQRVVKEGRVINEGDVQVSGFAPYPISYRALTPRASEAENLLVPVCLSSSHIAYGSVRMEPVFMILGQSAAIAASLALRRGCAVQSVPYSDLQRELTRAGQVLAWQPAEGESAAYEPEAPPPIPR